MPEGIERRESGDGTVSYRAWVWDPRERRKIRKTFSTQAAAKSWRSEAGAAVKNGRLRATTAPTLAEAIQTWLEGAEAGTIRTRGRRQYKPASIHAVGQHYRQRLEKPFGPTRLDTITRMELQEFIDGLEVAGLAAGTIGNTMIPLRVVYRWARSRGFVTDDPTSGLELPLVPRGTRVPPSPADAAALLAALPDSERALWGVAMLCGLRRGELFALRWEDVDLDAGTLHVERSWDANAQVFGTPKSHHGDRRVPIGSQTVPLLRAHMLATGRREGLIFGRTRTRPPNSKTMQAAADRAWKAAGLERVTLHACRHLYASMSIAAGVNAHALCKYMGHGSIQVTYDLYGHLFPGNEAEASALLDRYLTTAFAPRAQEVRG